jgi:hypothetical protein
MLEKGLSCKGCHIFHEEKDGQLVESSTYYSEAEACESCHGRGFSRILKDWEISTTKKLSQIKSIYSQVKREIDRTKHSDLTKAKDLLEEALFNIEIVEKGKSVHNVSFSQELLVASYNRMLQALEIVESPYKPQSFQVASGEIPTQCSNCHAGIEEIRTEIFGLDFPHKSHLLEQKIDCATCHSNVRKHGEFIATKQNCATCHHKDTTKDCSSCHRLQTDLYRGGRSNGQEIPKDIMAEAEVECLDCHLGDENQIYRSDKNKCAECHDEDYSDMYSEWQSSVKNLVQSISLSLADKRKQQLSEQERSTLREIQEFVRKIRTDGSHGIHNYMFIEEMLTNLLKKIKSEGTAN